MQNLRVLSLLLIASCSYPSLQLLASDDARGSDGSVGDGPPADTQMADAPRDAPWANDFVRMLDLDDSRITGAPHSAFPLLVSLSATWLRNTSQGGNIASSIGHDIYFSADPGGSVRLAHEVERYEPVTGVLVAWVKIPTLSENSVLYLHYGDAAITTSQQNVAMVWTGDYELVAHLDGTGDSTGKATSSSTLASGATTGRIGRAQPFNGTTDIIAYGSATAIDNIFVSGGTIETWIRPATTGENGFGRILSKEDASGWLLGIDDGNVNSSVSFQHAAATSSVGVWAAPSNTVAVNVWRHLVVVYDKDSASNTAALYVDGTSVTVTQVSAPSPPVASDAASVLVIGNRPAGDRTFDGLLDEARMSSVSRSAGWIATEYRNQSDPVTFMTVSAPL